MCHQCCKRGFSRSQEPVNNHFHNAKLFKLLPLLENLECDLCKMWHHCACQGVSAKLYKTISNIDEGDSCSLHWYCRGCNKLAKGILASVTSLQIQHTKLEDTVAKLGETVSKQSEQLEQLVNDKIEEMAEREKRRSNLIFFGVPESQNSEPGARKDDDLKKVRSLIKKSVGESRCSVLSLYRLGKKQDRSRPLKVIMDSPASRDEILRKFSPEEGEGGRPVAVARDRTKDERESFKKLKKEIQEREEKGEKDLIIRRGKIIQRKNGVNEESRNKGATRGDTRSDTPQKDVGASSGAVPKSQRQRQGFRTRGRST